MKADRVLRAYVALVIAFLALPVLVVVPCAFGPQSTLAFPPRGFTLRWFANVFASPDFSEAFLLSVVVAVCATAASVVAGTCVAIALVRFRLPGRDALMGLFLSPLIFPAVVLAAALAMVLGSLGLLRTLAGLVVAHALVTLPYMVRTVAGTLSEIEVSLEEAAYTLGADRRLAFRHVTLPLLRPGLLAGITFSLIISFDEFTISLFLVGPGMRTLPLEIYTYTDASIDPTLAAISTLLIVIALAAIITIERLAGFGKQFT